jgi:dephospho-CoA kinase
MRGVSLKSPLRIGLTGGIATGKSRVSRWFAETHQVPFISTDTVAHELLNTNATVRSFLQQALGEAALDSDTGAVHRSEVGKRLFSDAAFKQTLEALLHPLIREQVRRFFEATQTHQVPLCLAEVPLLLETGYRQLYDEVWLVYTPESQQRQRLREYRHLDEAAIDQRLASQLSIESKRSQVDRIIENSGSWEETVQQLERLYESLQSA